MNVGGKLGIIKDPFGTPEYIGATLPLAGYGITNLSLSEDGKVLIGQLKGGFAAPFQSQTNPNQSHAWSVAELIKAALAMSPEDRLSQHIKLPAIAEQLIGPTPSSGMGSIPVGTFFDAGPVNVSAHGNMGDVIEVDLKKLAADALAREWLGFAPTDVIPQDQLAGLAAARDYILGAALKNFNLDYNSIMSSVQDNAKLQLVTVPGSEQGLDGITPYSRGGTDNLADANFTDTGRMYLAPNITTEDEKTLRSGGVITAPKIAALTYHFQFKNTDGQWVWRTGTVTVTATDYATANNSHFFGDRPLDDPGYSAFKLKSGVGAGQTNDVLDVYRVEQRLKYLGYPAMGTNNPTTNNTIQDFNVIGTKKDGTIPDEVTAALKLFEKDVRYGVGVGSGNTVEVKEVGTGYVVTCNYKVNVRIDGVIDQSGIVSSLQADLANNITYTIDWGVPDIAVAVPYIGAARDAIMAAAQSAWLARKQKIETAVADGTDSSRIAADNIATTDLTNSLYGRPGKNNTGADGLIEASNADAQGQGQLTTDWLNAYNTPHWMQYFEKWNSNGITGWRSTQNNIKPTHTDVEIYGTSWLRDLMVARQYAPVSLRPLVSANNRDATFSGSVDANWGISTTSHHTHDLGMAMDMGISDFIGLANQQAASVVPTISIPATIGSGWNNTAAETLASLLNTANMNNSKNNQQAAVREFLSLYYVTQNDLKDSNNLWAISNGQNDAQKQLIQTALFRGDNTNNGSLIAFTHIGAQTMKVNGVVVAANHYTEIQKVLTQLNIGSSFVNPHNDHFHIYIKPPKLQSIIDSQPHNLLATGSDASILLAANQYGVDDANQFVLAAATSLVYDKKADGCSEVIGPNTKYVPAPDNLDSHNILRPELGAVYSFVKDPLVFDKAEYDSLMKDVQVSVVAPPKHGKLLPVQVNESKGYFYMAEPGYFGVDKVVFSIKFGNGKTILLNNFVSVVGSPSEGDQINACPDTPTHYQWMREHLPEIKKAWEDSNQSTNDYLPVTPLANFFSAVGMDNSTLGGNAIGSSVADAINVNLSFADLPGGAVGQTVGTNITLDDNAAGNGWFIDTTPADNSEFLPTSNPNEWVAKAGSDAAGKMDMLSVLLHEYGHALGIEHSADSGDYMGTTLTVGVRRLPSATELALMQQLIAQAKGEVTGTDSYASTLSPPLPLQGGGGLPLDLPLSLSGLAFAGLLRPNRYGSMSIDLAAPATQYEAAANATFTNLDTANA